MVWPFRAAVRAGAACSRHDPRRPPCIRYVAVAGARQSPAPASAPWGGVAGRGGAEVVAAEEVAVKTTLEAAVRVLASARNPPW